MSSTRAIVSLRRFRRNLEIIRKRVGHDTAICLSVKADAYGHGAVPIARAAVEAGVRWFAVATCEEALELRSGGITDHILLLSPPLPEEIPVLLDHAVSCVVADRDILGVFKKAARRSGTPAALHAAIDTGMGRFGCTPEHVRVLVADIADATELALEGIYTHFSAADSDDEYTLEQLGRFNRCLAGLELGSSRPLIHASNSAGLIGYPQASFDMVRPGIVAYGYPPVEQTRTPQGVEPVMELVSKLVFLKTVTAGSSISYGRTHVTSARTVIGTVAAGYADGYNRLLSNRGEAVIRNRRYPVVGRICMDQFMLDLGTTSDAELYDDVRLFGPSPPVPSAQDIADLIGTIPYEVLCAVSKRVQRIYEE